LFRDHQSSGWKVTGLSGARAKATGVRKTYEVSARRTGIQSKGEKTISSHQPSTLKVWGQNMGGGTKVPGGGKTWYGGGVRTSGRKTGGGWGFMDLRGGRTPLPLKKRTFEKGGVWWKNCKHGQQHFSPEHGGEKLKVKSTQMSLHMGGKRGPPAQKDKPGTNWEKT